MQVAVCIVGFRDPADVAGCLEALAAQTHADFTVTICENGGEACAETLRTTIPARLTGGQSVTVIAADNPGYAGGVNRCLAAAPRADAWWVLNPDARPAPDALAALIAPIEAGAADIVGGVLIEADGRLAGVGLRWVPWIGRMIAVGKHRPLSALPGLLGAQPQLISGACMLVAHRVVERIGPMREDYFLYAEEVEWLWRARKAGFRIALAENARVVHHQGSATGSADDIRSRPRLPIYLNARNTVNLTRDTRAAPPIAAAFGQAAIALVKYPRAGAWQQAGYALQGVWAGLRNERGKPRWLKG